jgi:hypothetical protein
MQMNMCIISVIVRIEKKKQTESLFQERMAENCKSGQGIAHLD